METRNTGVLATGLLAISILVLAMACASDPSTDGEEGGTGANGDTGGTGGAGTGGSGGGAGTGGAGTGGAGPGGAGTTGGAGAGGAGPGGTGGASADVDCEALTLPENPDDVISTFEDGTGAVVQAPGRGGGFYMFNDESEGAVQTPAPGSLPDATQVQRCDSLYALCVSGEGFTVWGAGMGTDLGPTAGAGDGGVGEKSPYDASEYTGIAFWAKSNGEGPVAVRVGFKDKNVAPEGGVCDENEASGDTACHDDWGKPLNFTTEWKPYTVTFAEVRQRGWGATFPEFDIENIYSLQFQTAENVNFDYCIDDLILVR